MAFTIIRSKRSLVKPKSEQKLPSATLDLSVIDSLPSIRAHVRTLHVFRKGGVEVTKVIKNALAKTLALYYPLAGKQRVSDRDYLQVECNGDGVWFVEASCESSLDSVNYFDDPQYCTLFDDLLPDHAPADDGSEPPVQVQVTQFGCGGFVVGLLFSHSICDGLGAAQFFKTVGEFARGQEKPSIPPVWKRDYFPPPPTKEPNSIKWDLTLPDYKLENVNVDITLEEIEQLKKEFNNSTGKICSTFQVVAAKLWRLRTRAAKIEDNVEVSLVFFSNCRQFLDPPVPEGFYGNCYYPMAVKASSCTLKEATNIEIIKLIQEAKTKVPSKFSEFVKGGYLDCKKDPFAPPVNYTTLFVTDWSKLGFNEVDYGFGSPMHFFPVQQIVITPVGIMTPLPPPKKGIRLMTWCVEEAHRQRFGDLMTTANMFGIKI